MATYYVSPSGNDSANGTTSGTAWRRLMTAHSRISPGDTVLLMTGTWHEKLTISKPNTTWKAAPGARPVIDGNYHFGLMSSGWVMPAPKNVANALPESNTLGLVGITETADYTSLEGLVIQNSAGRGIRCYANYPRIIDCTIYFTYSMAIHMDGLKQREAGKRFLYGPLMDGCWTVCGSIEWFDILRDGASAGKVGRTLAWEDVKGGIFRNGFQGYGFGEGFDCGKGNEDSLIEDSLFLHSHHSTLYCMYSRDTTIRRCAVVVVDGVGGGWDGALYGKGNPAGGIRVVDENTGKNYSVQNGFVVYDNIVIGFKHGIQVESGDKKKDGKYQSFTNLKRMYIGSNTVVMGPYNGGALQLNESKERNYHHEGIVENNVFYGHDGHEEADSGKGNIGAGYIAFRNNCWDRPPTSHVMRGTNDQNGNPNLLNPYRSIRGLIPESSEEIDSNPYGRNLCDFNPAYYAPTAVSVRVIDKALENGPAAHGATPPGDLNRDYLNYGRGASWDIGAIEYNGDSTPPDEVYADFSFSPTTGTAPLTVTFTDTSTEGGSASINSWSWNFGDGTTSTSANPTHEFAAGTWTVVLTVQDTVRGLSDTYSAQVVVESPYSVTANFTRTPASGVAPLEVTFTDTSTTSGGATINDWLWTFGDGTNSTLPDPVHTYAAVGTYTPSLRVRDTVLGLSHTVSKLPVTVSDSGVDGVLASFTATPSTGSAPLAVSFTDTSAETGAAEIDSWAWEFGDGATSASQHPNHTYAEAGTYTPRLTVSDTGLVLSSTVAGDPITVKTPGPTIGGDVALRVTRVALNTSDGEQTISTATLDGLVPTSGIFVVTAATTDDTAADGQMMSYGMAAGANQVAAAVAAEHGVADTNAHRRQVDDACVLLIDANGVEVMRATLVEWTVNGVTLDITWTGTPAAYLLTARFGAGSRYDAWVGTATVGSGVSVETGFAPQLVRAVSAWTSLDLVDEDINLSLGLAHESGGQYAIGREYRHGKADGENRLVLRADRIAMYWTPDGDSMGIMATLNDTGVHLGAVVAPISFPVLLMAESFGDVASQVSLVNSGLAAGAVDYATTGNPQYAEHLLSAMTTTGSSKDVAKAGSIGVHMADADGEFANVISGENGAATTNEQSLSTAELKVVGHSGATLVEGATAMVTEEYTVTYSTGATPSLKWPALAVEEGQAVAPGIVAEFDVDPATGDVPLSVAFTDLSYSSSPITSWMWDFGDGTVGEEQHPTHTYDEGGEFTVSLTVSDGTNEDTVTRAGAVVVRDLSSEIYREIIVGPLRARPVTDAAETVTHYHRGGPEAGWIDIGLRLQALPLADDGEEQAARPDEVTVWFDPLTGNLSIVRPDGVVGTISVNWGIGGTNPWDA